MSVYHIGVREVHVATVEIHLDDAHEELPVNDKLRLLKDLAEEKHSALKVEVVEYSHTMDREHWSIEKVK